MQRETQQLGNIACQRDLLWQLLVTRSGLDSELLPERPPAHNHRMRTYWNYCNAPSGVLFSPGVGIAKKDRGSVSFRSGELRMYKHGVRSTIRGIYISGKIRLDSTR